MPTPRPRIAKANAVRERFKARRKPERDSAPILPNLQPGAADTGGSNPGQPAEGLEPLKARPGAGSSPADRLGRRVFEMSGTTVDPNAATPAVDPANPAVDPAPVAGDAVRVTDEPRDDDDQPMTLGEARRLRRENQRAKADNQEAINAAVQAAIAEARTQSKAEQEAAQAELVKKFGTVLGVTPAEEAKELTPEELIAAARTQAEEATALAAQRAQDAADARRELALHRAISGSEADPDQILDSTAFINDVAEIDITAADFDARVAAAVEAALVKNPRFRKAPAAVTPTPPVIDTPRSGGDLSAGNGDPNSGLPEDNSVEGLRAKRKKRLESRR